MSYRKLCLDHPDIAKSMLLTHNQIAIVRMVRNHTHPTMTPRELADTRDLSIQAASQQLVHLWKKGYLERSERVQESGGIIYHYKACIT